VLKYERKTIFNLYILFFPFSAFLLHFASTQLAALSKRKWEWLLNKYEALPWSSDFLHVYKYTNKTADGKEHTLMLRLVGKAPLKSVYNHMNHVFMRYLNCYSQLTRRFVLVYLKRDELIFLICSIQKFVFLEKLNIAREQLIAANKKPKVVLFPKNPRKCYMYSICHWKFLETQIGICGQMEVPFIKWRVLLNNFECPLSFL